MRISDWSSDVCSSDLQTRPGFGDENYCGSMFTPGYRTIMNEKKSTQVYSHATFDIKDSTQLYGDVLLNQEKTSYQVGSNYTWWGSGRSAERREGKSGSVREDLGGLRNN